MVAVAVLGVIDRRRGADTSGRDPVVAILLAISLVLGALLASASIADGSPDWWPGLIVGPLAAALGFAAARSLFSRVRARLDDQTASALPLYAEGSALLGRRSLDPVPAAGDPRRGRAGVAADRWSPPGRREVRRAADPAVKKLVLAVIDAMKPAMLERAIATGRAPTLQLLIERGHYVDDCVAAFPSVTPVCAASIATGTGPGEHEIPAMNWWHRGEERYIEYGTSFGASRAFGIRQSLTDTIYNMNLEHLSKHVETVFERLDDADIRTAGTTYLMYRGRYRHEPSVDTALSRLAHTAFGMPTMGPRELFYADMFASRKTPCRSQLGLPGVRDQHSGCVAEYLVENDLFDFLLLSLPDNDTHSHKYGPFAQVDSIAAADRQIARMMEPAGGPEKFLSDHALIVCSDHSQSKVEGEIDLFKAFDGFGVRAAQRSRPEDEIAVCPNSRAAQVYVLDRDKRRSADPARRAHAAGARGRRPRDADGRSPGRRGDRPRRALARRQGAALRPARRPRRRPRGALERRGRPRPARPQDRRRPDPLAHLPGRHEPRLVGAALPDGRRGAGLRPPGLRVPRLGRRAPHRRRLARLAARQRLQRRADLDRHRPGEDGARAVGAARHRPDDRSTTYEAARRPAGRPDPGPGRRGTGSARRSRRPRSPGRRP